MALSVVELCAGAGGQSLGLEAAGFEHAAAVEIDPWACRTLRDNRPNWNVIEGDLHHFNGKPYRGADLVAGGVPCPPFSIAGKQLGKDDERDLFPEALRVVDEIQPKAVMLENVPGFASSKFVEYRNHLLYELGQLGYYVGYTRLSAADFGVPQLRPRFILVGLRKGYARSFRWPESKIVPPTVGEALADIMSSRNWPGVARWQKIACKIAPTLVGGSKKHGGPDLGPTRARKQWRELGVDGLGIADLPPGNDFPEHGLPRLTVQMAARIQGFPDNWRFSGRKTAAYKQVGNAFPPPVAAAVGVAIRNAVNRLSDDRRKFHFLNEPMRPDRQLELAF